MSRFHVAVVLLVLGSKLNVASDCSSKKNNTKTDWEFVLSSLIPEDYNPEDSPSINNEPVVINVTFKFWSLSGLSIPKQLIEVEFGVVATWRDERLLELAEPYTKRKRIPMPKTVVEQIWVPFVYFAGCRSCEDRDELFRGKRRELLYLPQEKIFQVAYGETKFFLCNFNLANYPFDSHECVIAMQFFDPSSKNVSAKLRHVELNWVTNAPDSHISLFGVPPEFVFDGLRIDDTCRIQDGNAMSGDQCLAYIVRFHRRIGHHMILVYIPTMMIVSVSWVSFWLEANAAAPRVTLGMTTLLTLTGIFSTSQQGLAQVSYVKALDVWILVCIFIVFASLLEFAYVFHTRKSVAAAVVHPVREEPIKIQTKNNPSETITELSTSTQRPPCKPSGTITDTNAHNMDVVSRYIFPAVFVLFNIFYWCICCLAFG